MSEAEFDSAEALNEHLHGGSQHGSAQVPDSASWHLEMSSDDANISLASATIQRCDDILNAQFERMESDLATSVPFSDEMLATDLLFTPDSITTAKSVVASAHGAQASTKRTAQAGPVPKPMAISMTAAAYSNVVPVDTAKSAAAAVQPASLGAHAFELPADDSHESAQGHSTEEVHEDRVSDSAPSTRTAASSPSASAPAKFLLHAPAAWYDDVPAVAEDSITLTAAAQAKQDDGFTPVVSKRRARCSATAAATPQSAARRPKRKQHSKSASRQHAQQPTTEHNGASADSTALRQRAREELVLSPAAGGEAKRLTAQVAKVVDEHTVLVRFTGDFAWVKTAGVVSLQSTKRVVPGAHVHVTATDVKQRPRSLAKDVPLPWYVQCSAVPVQYTSPAVATPHEGAASLGVPARPAAPAAAPPTAARPAPAGAAASAPAGTAVPSTAPNARAAAVGGKKKRVFNVNAAEFVPAVAAAPPVLSTGMHARMLPFAPPAAAAMAQYSAYAQHMARPAHAPARPAPATLPVPAASAVVTTATSATATGAAAQPAVRILQRPNTAMQ